MLKEENRRLDCALRMHQASNTQAMDNVFLQTQIDTLQWQLKQVINFIHQTNLINQFCINIYINYPFRLKQIVRCIIR